MQLIISIYYAFQITVTWLWVSAQVTLDAPIQSGGLSFQTRSNALSTGWLTRYHRTETSWGAAQWKADESKSQDFVVESNLFLPALLALHLVLTYEARVHWLAQPTMLLLISFLYQEDFGVDEGRLTCSLALWCQWGTDSLSSFTERLEIQQHFSDSLVASILDTN